MKFKLSTLKINITAIIFYFFFATIYLITLISLHGKLSEPLTRISKFLFNLYSHDYTEVTVLADELITQSMFKTQAIKSNKHPKSKIIYYRLTTLNQCIHTNCKPDMFFSGSKAMILNANDIFDLDYNSELNKISEYDYEYQFSWFDMYPVLQMDFYSQNIFIAIDYNSDKKAESLDLINSIASNYEDYMIEKRVKKIKKITDGKLDLEKGTVNGRKININNL